MSGKQISILLISIDESALSPNVEADRSAFALRERGYKTDILHFHGVQNTRLESQINQNYDLVGVAVRQPAYKYGFNNGIDIIKYLKKQLPTMKAFVMGHFATANMESIVNDYPCIDYVLLGDSIELVVQLADSIECGADVNSVHIATRTDFHNKQINVSSAVYKSTSYDFYETDSLVNNAAKTHQLQFKNSVCNGKCTFCEWRSSRVGEFSFRDKRDIIDEIRTVREKYGVKHFFISDADLFSPNNEWYFDYLSQIFCEIERLHIDAVFTCFCRACSLYKSDETIALLKQMKKGGLTTAFVGVDGGNAEDLKLYGKGTTAEMNMNCVNLFRECGIYPMIGFIFINAYSTPQRLTENFNTLCALKCIDPNMYARSFLKVYRGTPIYTKMKNDGLLYESCGITGLIPYQIIDEQVRSVHAFLRDNLAEFVKGLPITMDQLCANFYDYAHLYPQGQCNNRAINTLIDRYYTLLTDFFSVIFVEFNLEKAADRLPSFKHDLLSLTDELVALNNEFAKKVSNVWGK